jgi:PleD family two-component response regulator
VREDVRTLTFEAGDVLYGVTASFGLAEWRKGLTAKDLLASADQALYWAKSSGKDCTAGSALTA